MRLWGVIDEVGIIDKTPVLTIDLRTVKYEVIINMSHARIFAGRIGEPIRLEADHVIENRYFLRAVIVHDMEDHQDEGF